MNIINSVWQASDSWWQKVVNSYHHQSCYMYVTWHVLIVPHRCDKFLSTVYLQVLTLFFFCLKFRLSFLVQFFVLVGWKQCFVRSFVLNVVGSGIHVYLIFLWRLYSEGLIFENLFYTRYTVCTCTLLVKVIVKSLPTLPFNFHICLINTWQNGRRCHLWKVFISSWVLSTADVIHLMNIAIKWVHHILYHYWSAYICACRLNRADGRFPDINICYLTSWQDVINSTFLNPDSRDYKLSTVTLYSMNKVKCSNATLAFRTV